MRVITICVLLILQTKCIANWRDERTKIEETFRMSVAKRWNRTLLSPEEEGAEPKETNLTQQTGKPNFLSSKLFQKKMRDCCIRFVAIFAQNHAAFRSEVRSTNSDCNNKSTRTRMHESLALPVRKASPPLPPYRFSTTTKKTSNFSSIFRNVRRSGVKLSGARIVLRHRVQSSKNLARARYLPYYSSATAQKVWKQSYPPSNMPKNNALCRWFPWFPRGDENMDLWI